MRKVLKIASVLSWINLVLWGFFTAVILLASVVAHNFALILGAFLLSVVVLHSYACLQLHKSVRNPAIPLGNQTPVGVRFLGFVALFFGVGDLTQGIALMQNAKEVLDALKSQTESLMKFPAGSISIGLIRTIGAASFLVGLSVAVNVFLNLRLLRWFTFMRDRQSDKDQ